MRRAVGAPARGVAVLTAAPFPSAVQEVTAKTALNEFVIAEEKRFAHRSFGSGSLRR